MQKHLKICLVWAAVLCNFSHFQSSASEFVGGIPLVTELKVSGPTVSVRFPLGARYRPGYTFPIEVFIQNNGAEFNADIQVVEGDAESGARNALLPAVPFQANSSKILPISVRAPSVSATLMLTIREADNSGGMGPLRFRASLSRVLKPLGPEGRIVISCGAVSSSLPHGGFNGAARIAAKEFPSEAWMYASVDLVVLADASLRDAPASARTALRQWLLGGGRVLVASNTALPMAVTAGLMPLDIETVKVIGADMAWWESHAGLRADDILASKNNRPVYARLKMGHGQTVFLFPATSPDDAAVAGAAIVNHPALQRELPRLPDLRIQPDRFAAFAAGSASAGRRSISLRWILAGAAVFCASLGMAFKSRSRLVTMAWPLALTALLGVMLARWFPVPELIVSRIELDRVSDDFRACARHEWTCVETFREPRPISITGPSGGLLTPLYADNDELKASQPLSTAGDQRLSLQNLLVVPNQPLLVSSSLIQVQEPVMNAESVHTLKSRTGKMSLVCSDVDGNVPKAEAALLVRADQTLWLITEIDAKEGFLIRRIDDTPSVIREAFRTRDDVTVRSRTTALSWATREAYKSGRDTLILLNPPAQAPLGELEDAAENGSRFVLRTMSVNLSGTLE